MINSGFSQHFAEPNRRPSTLDLVLSRTSQLVRNVMNCPPFGRLNHSLIRFHLLRGARAREDTVIRNFKHEDYEGLSSFVISAGMKRKFTELFSVNEKYVCLVSVLHRGTGLFIPLLRFGRHPKKIPDLHKKTA